MFVEDLMTSSPYTIRQDAALALAADLMARHRIHHLPVLDEANRLTGMISDRDVRSAIGFDRTLGEKLTVSEAMTPDPVTIDAEATLEDALSVLSSGRFGALPVMRHGAAGATSAELVGILTTLDLLRALHQILGLEEPGRRLEVALPHGCKDIARVFRALAEGEHPIISAVVSRMRRDGPEASLYLRVPEGAARGVQHALQKATAILLQTEQLSK
ncbi:MAG: CBS domain-containing protein [Phycisphaerales bacterium]|nr:CBS domain-containing protein [Phycisphaerales bacterium]